MLLSSKTKRFKLFTFISQHYIQLIHKLINTVNDYHADIHTNNRDLRKNNIIKIKTQGRQEELHRTQQMVRLSHEDRNGNIYEYVRDLRDSAALDIFENVILHT